jgi:hypothetical protein
MSMQRPICGGHGVCGGTGRDIAHDAGLGRSGHGCPERGRGQEGRARGHHPWRVPQRDRQLHDRGEGFFVVRGQQARA